MSLKQLLKLGKLREGEDLVWNRRSLKVHHTAKVLEGGVIQTADGVVHKTPSGAAKHLNNGKPVDGWIAWKLANGLPLASLR